KVGQGRLRDRMDDVSKPEHGNRFLLVIRETCRGQWFSRKQTVVHKYSTGLQLVHQGWTKRSPNTIENDIATRGPGCPAKSLLPSGVAGANNLAPEVWVRHCSSRRSARRTYRLYASVVQ